MRVYKEFAHVSYDNEKMDKFIDEVTKHVSQMQNKNMEVEIKYTTCATNNTFVFSALILGFTEE